MTRGGKEQEMGAGKSGTPTDLKNLSNDELSHQLIESLRSTVELARLHLSVDDFSGIRQKTRP